MTDDSAPAATFSARQTPETYLGYERAEGYEGPVSRSYNTAKQYRFPGFLPDDAWGLRGQWLVESQKIVAQEAGATLQLNFTAKKVFLVLGTATGKPIHATVTLNGAALTHNAGKDAPNGKLLIDRNRLYELIDQSSVHNALVEIQADEPGLEAYAFTFGS
ncbi:MAG TPA: hypothetical protein PLV25_04165 [Opitutales bacterium]|nr:hypothetical protein [Opitutales bacterium]